MLLRMIRAVIHRSKKATFWLLYGRNMKRYSRRSTIIDYLKIQGAQFMTIGDGVYVHKYAWLGAYPINAEPPSLEIGDGCTIGNFNHISCVGRMVIGKKVLTADKVYISDNLHDYRNPDLAIMDQGILTKAEVTIGDGAWIGENVCIIGAKVGRNAIIGSNSVVTRDVPDYCIAVGSPATVIKKYNFATGIWERV